MILDPRKRRRHRPRKHKVEAEKSRSRSWFLVTLAAITWTTLVFIIIFVDPQLLKDIAIPSLYLPFFLVLFAALALTFFLIFLRLARAFLYSFAIVLFLMLRAQGMGNILNTILIIALVFVTEHFFLSSKSDKPSSSVSAE